MYSFDKTQDVSIVANACNYDLEEKQNLDEKWGMSDKYPQYATRNWSFLLNCLDATWYTKTQIIMVSNKVSIWSWEIKYISQLLMLFCALKRTIIWRLKPNIPTIILPLKPNIPKKKRKGFRRFCLTKHEYTDNDCTFKNDDLWTRAAIYMNLFYFRIKTNNVKISNIKKAIL